MGGSDLLVAGFVVEWQLGDRAALEGEVGMTAPEEPDVLVFPEWFQPAVGTGASDGD